jgi:hypothetical protein
MSQTQGQGMKVIAVQANNTACTFQKSWAELMKTKTLQFGEQLQVQKNVWLL